MSRTKHDLHFADLWARQCAARERWQSTSGGVESRHAQPEICPAGMPGAETCAGATGFVRSSDGDHRPISRAGVAPGPLTNKYGNRRTNGYASEKEMHRAADLWLLQRVGVIQDLREQVSYLLIPKQGEERACSYVADFVYRETGGAEIVEDCKGFRTSEYIIKRKLMLFVHGIAILET